MPAISSPAKVLVTGASGFIGIHIVKALIDAGFDVRGTVRAAGKGDYVKKLFGDPFQYVVIENMTEPNAFDKAVEGVDAVIHAANPVLLVMGHPEALIKTTIAGTANILESSKAYGSQVKRVVIISSISTLGDQASAEVELTETTWFDGLVERVNELGAAADPGEKYSAGKLLAEKAAWEFMEKNKGSLSFDLTTLHPCLTWGPLIHEGTEVQSINGSCVFLMHGIDTAASLSDEDLTKKTLDLVDARDVAKATKELLEREGAAWERFIVAGRSWSWQDVLDALNKEPAVAHVPLGKPGTAKKWPSASSAKLCALVGQSREEFYIPFEETVKATLNDCRARGWSGIGAWMQARPQVL